MGMIYSATHSASQSQCVTKLEMRMSIQCNDKDLQLTIQSEWISEPNASFHFELNNEISICDCRSQLTPHTNY